MTIRVQIAAAATAATLGLAVASAMAAAPTPDDPSAMLAQAKSTSGKLGSWLESLSQEYRAARGKGVTDKQFKSSDKKLRVVDGKVSVDLYATNSAELRKSLQALGATHIQNVGPLMSARVPVSQLDALGATASLVSARPAMAVTQALPPNATSQGVVSMRADIARTQNNVDGAGVTVGVLSDSFACNPPPFYPGTPTSTMQQDINTGELPTQVTILEDGPCPATDEGRGMAQLVHDVAPGSPIAFHTAFNSELDFAEGIQQLDSAAGAKVIVDDVIWFDEPMFSDGMIAQAADIVARRGVPYFSSAGNQARNSYENAFRGVNVAINASGNATGAGNRVARFHDFDPGPGVQVLQPVAVVPDSEAGDIVFSFQWDQPFRSATTYAWLKAGKSEQEAAQLAKGARSDLDIVFFDAKGHLVPRCPPGVARGITCQFTGDRNVGGDAVDLAELYYSGPPKTPQLFYIAFVVTQGPDPDHVKYVWFDERGSFVPLAFDTKSGTAYGHANAGGANSVGASSWYATVPFSTSGNYPPNDTYHTPPIAPSLAQCAPACLNDFSSAGRIPVYFDRFGNRLDSPDVRQNPAFTGPDGGNTSFFYSDSSYDDDDGDGLNSPLSTFVTPLDQPADEYPNFFGTSAAAPHTAAVAALMLQKKSSLTPDQVRQALQDTARAIDKRFTSARPIVTDPIHPIDGYNWDAGRGLVDAAAALQALP